MGEQTEINELKQIPGIGEKKAKKIIKYRENDGGFKSEKELMKIPGIGRKAASRAVDILLNKRDMVEITFNPADYGLNELNEVHLVGEMNNWDPADKSYSLKKDDNGIWRNIFALQPGTEYKFIYDATSWESGNEIGNGEGRNLKVD